MILLDSLSGLSGLLPMFVIPISVVVALITIPIVVTARRKTGFGTSLLLFLFSVLDLAVGYAFLNEVFDAYKHSSETPSGKWSTWLLASGAFSAVVLITGICGACIIFARLAKKINKSQKDRMG